MNPYTTPCRPDSCERYRLDCDEKSTCIKSVNYQILKDKMAREKNIRKDTYSFRSGAIDKVYCTHRNTPKRVGQK
jgi:hypothetical protein